MFAVITLSLLIRNVNITLLSRDVPAAPSTSSERCILLRLW